MDLSSAANRFELKQRKRADHAMNPRKRVRVRVPSRKRCRRNAVNELQEKLFSRTEPNLSRRWFYFEMFDKMVEMETILPGSHEEVFLNSPSFLAPIILIWRSSSLVRK